MHSAWALHLFADAFIPLSPVAPIFQVVLLVIIIFMEGSIIRGRLRKKGRTIAFWLKVTSANIATGVVGLFLTLPVASLESQLVFGWGSDSGHPFKWYTACFLYGLGIPWAVWFVCYHISWRTEFWLLKMMKEFGELDEHVARESVRTAHRRSYGLLALPVLAATLWYWLTVFHPL